MPVVDMGEGNYAIINTRGSSKATCQFCESPSRFLCDFRVSFGKPCDKRMCSKHRTRIATGVDYCPDHKGAQGEFKKAA